MDPPREQRTESFDRRRTLMPRQPILNLQRSRRSAPEYGRKAKRNGYISSNVSSISGKTENKSATRAKTGQKVTQKINISESENNNKINGRNTRPTCGSRYFTTSRKLLRQVCRQPKKDVATEDKKTSKNLSWLSRQQPPRYTQTPKEQT